MARRFYTILFTFLIAFSFSLAQTGVGRIAGKVIDKQTGEPLIGANIIVEGTNFGAATDANGEYRIDLLPPGDYSVKASYLGYQTVTVKNVRVVSGLTSEVNFQMVSSEIATGVVVITAEKPLIEKSATNAKRIISSEDLESLPTRSIDNIVALQPGVVQLNGVTFIRGSRGDETGYTLEGADIKNILSSNGGSLVTVIPDALQEITVQAGGYTAEFGNANAGIVSQDFKTGTDEYHFSFRAETDNFGNYPGETFLGTYSYGYSDLVLTASGPIIPNTLKFFLSGENFFTRDRNPHFFDGNPAAYSDGALFDTTKVYDSGFFGGSKSDYQILKWQPGNVPGRMRNRYTLNGTLLYDANPLLIRVAGAFTWQRRQNNGPTLFNLFNQERVGQSDFSNLLLNAKVTYLTGANSYFTANVNYYNGRGKTYDPIFKDNYMAYSDSLEASKYGFEYRSYTSGPSSYDFYGFPFNRRGSLTTGYFKFDNSYLGGSVSYTTQIKKHSFKTGASYQRWTVRGYGLRRASSLLSSIRNDPEMASNKDSLLLLIGRDLFRSFNNYGYDPFGNEVDNGPFRARHPILASGYVEDRLEVKDMILNVGLRYDYINMDSWALKDPKKPSIDNQRHVIPDSSLGEGSTFSYLSPRIGLSFPVTDRTVFHLQYGKFVQSPSLDIAYKGIYRATEILIGANMFPDPVAYDPQPVRTTSYEVGFAQQFSDFAALDITAFYKDIKGQIQYASIVTQPGAFTSSYVAYINQDFATTKGVEFSLKIRRVERVMAQLNYTYSDARGTNSFVGSGVGSVNVNNEVPTVLLPLTYNYTHSGSVFIDYRFGENDGGPLLERLGFNLLFTFNSGHPFTYAKNLGLGQSQAWTGGLIPSSDTRGRRPIGPPNSATTPWQFNVDLRVDKTVNIGGFDFNFYVYVQNLFNTKNVINVYQKTGNAYDDGFLGSPDAEKILSSQRFTQRFADLYKAINLGNRQHAFSTYGYDLFGSPRQIRVGVKVNL